MDAEPYIRRGWCREIARWTGYRTGQKPTIRIKHHKTGAVIDHPLEERLPTGEIVRFYEEAEVVLATSPRTHDSAGSRGRRFQALLLLWHAKDCPAHQKAIGLPKEFTLDACRHGGMTELEEAELTEGQGRALSAHRTRESYAAYAKRTEARMLSATRKRHAHMLANQLATDVQDALMDAIQNAESDNSKIA